jgi:hypothetical protein
MKRDTLRRAAFLEENIDRTETALQAMKNMQGKKDTREFSDLVKGDGYSWLCISQHTDGSGIKADLFRGEGNAELIDVIIRELTRQLAEMQKEFDAL